MTLLVFNSTNELPVTYTVNAALTVLTVHWTPPENQTGFMWIIDGQELLSDGKRHFSFSDTIAQSSIALIKDGQPHDYSIKILTFGSEGTITITP